MLKCFVVAASIAASSAAFAAPAHLNDVQYLTAARCDGLTASAALGKSDTAAIDAVLKSEGRSRSPEIMDRAEEMRADALREAGHAGPLARQGLIAERDRLCQAWVQPTTTTAAIADHRGAN
jgi:hypothetical protein